VFYTPVINSFSKQICIGNSMVSSAIWEKHAQVSFSKDYQNCTSQENIGAI
jgi:hypothetical protein